MSNITMPADTDTMIFKTKYTRRRNGKPESFVGYDISINGNEKIIFPKGTTLPQIKKAYPQHADAVVVVMPNHILKGISTAECEEITTVTVKKNYTTTPADVVIEKTTAEEQAADLATEPENTIYTVEKERPAVVAATEQPAKSEPTLEEWIAAAEVKTTAAKPAPQATTEQAAAALAKVSDWASLQAWIAAHPKHDIVRKKDGAKAVIFEEYNDGVVCIVLANEKEAYPYYRVLSRYFDVVPM